jgi:hypothetical protein
VSLFFFKFSLKRKKIIQNTTNFSFDVGSKQRQLKSYPKIIINQTDWGRWVCNFFLDFKHIVMVDCNASKSNHWLLDWFRTQVVTIGD